MDRDAVVMSVYWLIVGYARRLSPTLADDLSQEGFVEVLERFYAFRPQDGRASTYFGLIAYRRMKRWRDFRNHVIQLPWRGPHAAVPTVKRLVIDVVDEREEPVEVALERREQLALLPRLIESLPMKLRYVIKRKLAGATQKQIAGELGLDRKLVREMEKQAREQMYQTSLKEDRKGNGGECAGRME